MTSPMLCASLEAAINHYLHLDSDVKPKLAVLTGKVVEINVVGVGLSFTLYFGEDRVFVLPECEREPDCRMTGAPFSMAKLGLGKKTAGAMFDSGVTLDGDMEVGRAVQRLLDGLEIDYEEQLSKYVGDVIAHQVGNFVRDIGSWGRQMAQTMATNGAEYLQEETRNLPHPTEVEQFLDNVDKLRNDVDRLMARVNLIKQHILEKNSEAERK